MPLFTLLVSFCVTKNEFCNSKERREICIPAFYLCCLFEWHRCDNEPVCDCTDVNPRDCDCRDCCRGSFECISDCGCDACKGGGGGGKGGGKGDGEGFIAVIIIIVVLILIIIIAFSARACGKHVTRYVALFLNLLVNIALIVFCILAFNNCYSSINESKNIIIILAIAVIIVVTNFLGILLPQIKSCQFCQYGFYKEQLNTNQDLLDPNFNINPTTDPSNPLDTPKYSNDPQFNSNDMNYKPPNNSKNNQMYSQEGQDFPPPLLIPLIKVGKIIYILLPIHYQVNKKLINNLNLCNYKL